jgi:hypothetical protein
MRFTRPEKKTLVSILIKRGAVFLAVLLLLTVFLYIIGTIQGFTDQTQLLLLDFSLMGGLSLAAASIYGLISSLWLILRGPNRRPFFWAGAYIVLGVFGMVITALAAFILVLAEGNSL